MENKRKESIIEKKGRPKILFCFTLLVIVTSVLSEVNCRERDSRTPEEMITAVADKIISETSFELVLKPQKTKAGLQFVDFRDLFGDTERGVGYALTFLRVPAAREVRLGLISSDGVKLWLNDEMIFRREVTRSAPLVEEGYERFQFQDTLKVRLKSGDNKLLVKVETGGGDWVFYLGVMNERGKTVTDVSFSLTPLSLSLEKEHWLCLGPFDNPIRNGKRVGLDTVYPPEEAIELGRLYEGNGKQFSWTLPRRHVLVELVSPFNDWTYSNGALMYGILKVGEVTGDRKYTDFVRRYADFILDYTDYFQWQYTTLHALRGSFHRIFRRTMLDDTGAPILPFIELYQRTKEEKYWKPVEPVANYITHRQVRLEDGTFARPEPERYTVWADDLFMSVPFLMRMGKTTGEVSYYDDGARQLLQFAHRLMDKEKQLFYHGWFSRTKTTSIALWGRANGWAVMAEAEALGLLPEDHPFRQKVLNLFRRHVEGLARVQAPDGMWHQVLDHPESYEETSCTAMFVYGIAKGVNSGWLDQKYAEISRKGWKALKRKIREDGTVLGTCRGTGIGFDLDYYFNRPTPINDPRGLGAVMLAGSEMIRLEKAVPSSE